MKRVPILVAVFSVLLICKLAFGGIFFQDSFESEDLSHTNESSGARWTASNHHPDDSVQVSSDRAHTGKYSLKFVFQGGPSGDDAWAEQRFSLGQPMYDLYVRFYILFPQNFRVRLDSPNNNKVIVVWGDDYSSKGAQGQEFDKDKFMPKVHKIWLDGGWVPSCDGNFGNIASYRNIGHWSLSELPLNEWVCFEYHFRPDSGNGDGAVEFWVNGEKKYGATGLKWINAPCSPPYFNRGYLLGWANSGYDQDTVIYIDDVVFSDEYIGPSGQSNGRVPGAPPRLRAE